MKTLRKILASVLAVLMLAGIVPIASINSFAADDILQYLTYKIEDGVAKITGCDKEISGDITLPSMIENCPVVEISEYAFWYCKNITSVTIPFGVTHIGKQAFFYCDNLKSVSLPESVINIYTAAFSNCAKLTKINIPDSVENFGSADCKMKLQ